MSQFDDKLKLSVYCHSDKSPLNHFDGLAWSYLTYQAKFNAVPSVAKVSAKTGMSERTVSESLGRLRDFGLIDRETRKAVLPRASTDWFQFSTKKQTGLRYWQSYIRAPIIDNPLSVPDVSLYSYLRSKVLEGFNPPHGWSKAYLSKAVHLNRNTVQTSLQTLKEHGLIALSEDDTAKLGVYGSLTGGRS